MMQQDGLWSAKIRSRRCAASLTSPVANSDLIDNLGVVVFSSIAHRAPVCPLFLTTLFASFRSRAALQPPRIHGELLKLVH